MLIVETNEEKLAMAIPEEQKGSFLAFLYHIRFTPEYREAFRWKGDYKPDPKTAYKEPGTHQELMNAWQLTERQRYLLVAVDLAERGAIPNEMAQGLWTELVHELIPEFRSWTEPPPDWW